MRILPIPWPKNVFTAKQAAAITSAGQPATMVKHVSHVSSFAKHLWLYLSGPIIYIIYIYNFQLLFKVSTSNICNYRWTIVSVFHLFNECVQTESFFSCSGLLRVLRLQTPIQPLPALHVTLQIWCVPLKETLACIAVMAMRAALWSQCCPPVDNM